MANCRLPFSTQKTIWGTILSVIRSSGVSALNGLRILRENNRDKEIVLAVSPLEWYQLSGVPL